MFKLGMNVFDGVSVAVVRKRCRRINLRVDAAGAVRLTLPLRGATLQQGEDFLRAK